MHVSTSEVVEFNLVTGKTTITQEYLNLKISHGVLLWTAYSLLLTVGIFFARNRFLFADEKLWITLHRAFNGSAFLIALIGLAISIVFTAKEKNSHFTTTHGQIGLAIIIVHFLQLIGGNIRPKLPQKGEKVPLKYAFWLFFHRFIGFILWAIAQYLNYNGITLLTKKSLPYAQIGWIVLVVLIFVGFEIYKLVKRPSKTDEENETGMEQHLQNETINDDSPNTPKIEMNTVAVNSRTEPEFVQ